MRKILSAFALAAIIFSLFGCADAKCDHHFSEATCNEPKKCTICGLVMGKPLGHKVEGASCTKAGTCSVCGQVIGSAPGHDFAEATCTEPKKCRVCGLTEGEPKGHCITQGVCVTCQRRISNWDKKYYLDEFKNPTSEIYITSIDEITGTFSNSATTDSKLKAELFIDKEGCGIKLYEYGSHVVKAYRNEKYNVTVMLSDGEKKEFTGTIYEDTDKLVFDDSTSIIDCMKGSEGTLKIFIKEDSSGYNSTYLFSVNMLGFKNTYEENFS